jgi:hypothetical protein
MDRQTRQRGGGISRRQMRSSGGRGSMAARSATLELSYPAPPNADQG